MNTVEIQDEINDVSYNARILEAAILGLEASSCETKTVTALAVHAGRMVDTLEKISERLAVMSREATNGDNNAR